MIEIIEENPIEMLKVKQILSKKKELSEREGKVKEYIDVFGKLDVKKSAELRKKLNSLEISRLKDRHITKIIDLLPEDVDDLKVLMAGEPLSLKQEDIKKIVDVVKKFV
ncbi:hypothetical protein CL618_01615 [archaeon]|jgi:DNA-directed RNA polymerase subunit F|nr:hypothetical protein [archaeon]|tara:strand:+ start:946 stop:1272 length:327 start_codon:yes stop_codon:yes gene_type:complete